MLFLAPCCHKKLVQVSATAPKPRNYGAEPVFGQMTHVLPYIMPIQHNRGFSNVAQENVFRTLNNEHVTKSMTRLGVCNHAKSYEAIPRPTELGMIVSMVRYPKGAIVLLQLSKPSILDCRSQTCPIPFLYTGRPKPPQDDNDEDEQEQKPNGTCLL